MKYCTGVDEHERPCLRPHYARGLCRRHYGRVFTKRRNHRDPESYNAYMREYQRKAAMKRTKLFNNIMQLDPPTKFPEQSWSH